MPETMNTEIKDTQAPSAPATDAGLRQQAIAAAEEVQKLEQEKASATTTPATPPSAPETTGLDVKKLALQVARLEKQLRDQKSGYEKTQKEYEGIVNRLKDPEQRYALIEEHGGDYQDWTNRIVAGTKPQRDQRDVKIDQLEQSLQRLQSQLEQRSQAEQEQTKEQSLNKAKEYASTYVETNKSKYPCLSALQRSELLVQEAIRRQKEGLPINDEEIAIDIENQMVTQIKSELQNLIKLDVFSKFLTELGFAKSTRNVSETEQTQQATKGSTTESQTLTNDLSGEPSSGFDYSKATEEQLRERARKIANQSAAAERRRISQQINS